LRLWIREGGLVLCGGGFMLRNGGVGFCFAAVGGGGGGSRSLSRGCWDFWWVVVAGLTGLWVFFFGGCCCWIFHRCMDLIVVELFTDIRILLLLVVLDMFSDLYKFPGFVFFMFFKVLLFLFF
jgi:hypothetical protein